MCEALEILRRETQWVTSPDEEFTKARIRQHTRTTPSGKLAIVKEHQRKDQPTPPAHDLELPPEPGTVPLPAGKIRGYHYTGHLDAVLREGLDAAHARGETTANRTASGSPRRSLGHRRTTLKCSLTLRRSGSTGQTSIPTTARTLSSGSPTITPDRMTSF